MRFLLPGKLRGLSAIVFFALGLVGVSMVVLFLVALIAFIVKRSGESIDSLPTVTAVPIYRADTATATFVPPMLQVTVGSSSTLTPTSQLSVETATEPTIEMGWMKVTHTGSLGLRLRSGPGLSYETTGVFEDGVELRVLGGPEKADDIVWWKLESESGEVGWAAGNFLEPVKRTGSDINE